MGIFYYYTPSYYDSIIRKPYFTAFKIAWDIPYNQKQKKYCESYK